jgi:hypothetical protein
LIINGLSFLNHKNTEGVLAFSNMGLVTVAGVYLPLVWTTNIRDIGFEKPRQHVGLGLWEVGWRAGENTYEFKDKMKQ